MNILCSYKRWDFAHTNGKEKKMRHYYNGTKIIKHTLFIVIQVLQKNELKNSNSKKSLQIMS